jgi:hypothetical protein
VTLEAATADQLKAELAKRLGIKLADLDAAIVLASK